MKRSANFLLSALFVFLACEKDDAIPSEPHGVWVEKSMRRDTIIFNSPKFDFGDYWFDLRRDEMLSTGPYEYRIEADSISINWMLSSCMCWKNYYFRMANSNEFTIGKFYDSEKLNSSLLSFEKLNAIK